MRWFGGADGASERRRPTKRAGLLRSDRQGLEIDAQRLSDAGAVCGIGPVTVDDLPRDDLDRHALHRRLVVLEELVLLVGRHQPEQLSGLTIVVVAVAMIVAGRLTHDLERRFAVALVLKRAIERVRLIEGVRVRLALEPHRTVGVIIVHLYARPVDRKLVRGDAG